MPSWKCLVIDPRANKATFGGRFPTSSSSNNGLDVALLRALVGFFAFVTASPAWGAACCGGGFASPSVMAGDERAQVTTQISTAHTSAEVDSQGYWRSRPETSEVLRLDAAHLLSDRWQAGVSAQWRRRALAGRSRGGWGDTAATVAWEFLPDWTYHPYRPKGLGWMQLVVPTGRSVHETQDPLGSTGRGFWALGIGSLLTKTWVPWDAFLSLEGHRGFPRNFEGRRFRPGWGGAAGGGAGRSFGRARIGIQAIWSWEGAVAVGASPGAQSRWATLAATGSWMFSDEWAASLQWSDQTILGAPSQASLGRAAGLHVQRRWLR